MHHDWLRLSLVFGLFPLAPFAQAGSPASAASPAGGSPPSITLLDAQAARAAIVDDASDPYFSRLQTLEMTALTGKPITGATIEEQRAECRLRFQVGMLDFTERESNGLRQLIADLYPLLERRYAVFARTPWSLMKSSDRLCGAMPYTRGHHIVFAESQCQFFAAAASRKNGPAKREAFDLLVHEQMHVVQRDHPHFFDSLYTEVLGFKFIRELGSDPYLVKYQMANPDGMDCRWVFPLKSGPPVEYLLPLMLIDDRADEPQMPGDMRTVGVSIQKTARGFQPQAGTGGKPLMRNLNSVPEYRKRFGTGGNNYHPHELIADMFAAQCLAEMAAKPGEAKENADLESDNKPVSPNENGPEPLQVQAGRWFRQHFAETEKGKSTPADHDH